MKIAHFTSTCFELIHVFSLTELDSFVCHFKYPLSFVCLCVGSRKVCGPEQDPSTFGTGSRCVCEYKKDFSGCFMAYLSKHIIQFVTSTKENVYISVYRELVHTLVGGGALSICV